MLRLYSIGERWTSMEPWWKCNTGNPDVFPFIRGWTSLVGLGLLMIEVSRTHSDTPHSVGFLWTSDQLVAETSTWQHNTSKRQTSMPPAAWKPKYSTTNSTWAELGLNPGPDSERSEPCHSQWGLVKTKMCDIGYVVNVYELCRQIPKQAPKKSLLVGNFDVSQTVTLVIFVCVCMLLYTYIYIYMCVCKVPITLNVQPIFVCICVYSYTGNRLENAFNRRIKS